MTPAERKQLQSLLDELIGAVEELLLAGLTTASKSTVERFDVTFKEASRMRLLRLGSTLRIANEEISRFTTNSAQFSPKRLAFFLGRAFLLTSVPALLSTGGLSAGIGAGVALGRAANGNVPCGRRMRMQGTVFAPICVTVG